MKQVRNQVASLLNQFDFLNCLETGTIRTFTEKHESTRHISEIIGKRGRLKSLDITPAHIKISKEICKNAQNVEWILTDSVEYLKKDRDKYHFVLLDSANSAELIFEEFTNIVDRIHTGGVLMVDDAGIGFNKERLFSSYSGHKPKKGLLVNEFLLKQGAQYSIVKGGGGYHGSTQLRLKLTPENRKKINA